MRHNLARTVLLRTLSNRHFGRRASLLLLATAFAFSVVSDSRYSPAARAQEQKLQRQQDLRAVFSAYEELRLDPQAARQQVRASGRLTLRTFSHRFELQLELNDMRAPNYRAEEVVNGVKRELPRLEVNTYRGTIDGMPGTDARFTLDGVKVEGMILTLDEAFFIEPARNYSAAADESDYLLYRESDVRSDIEWICAETLHGKIDLQTQQVGPQSQSLPPAPNIVVPTRVVEFASEADDEFVAAAGGSAAANNEILSIMNQVDAIYRRDVGLTFTIVFQHTFNGGDPYVTNDDALAVLTEFKDYWSRNISNPRDEAHMWTGRSLGAPAGVAYQGEVCRNVPYGVSERGSPGVFRIGIPAHEIGHNFGATHCDGQAGCDNTIMVATQNQSNTLTFCQFSIDQMTNYVNANNGCLGVATATTIQLSSTVFAGLESDGQVNVTVTRVGDTSGTATVKYATSDTAGLQGCSVVNGRASERCDYVTSAGTVRFAAGELSKNFIIPVIDDVWLEGAETFTVTLSNAVGASVGAPAAATLTITDNDATPSSNPIDGVQFFVSQQYLDILGRQPDQTGFQNWVNTLGNCPNGGFGEPPTSTCDRLHVAAGFFQSDEFLNRGYWAFRMYMVSFQFRPSYSQFIPDMAQVGGPKSPAEEDAAKAAFAEEFVLRPAFTQRYGGASGQALANALTANAFLPPYTVTGGQTNGQILRAIAERQSTLDRFLVEGTVSILYFGFQRRDPDAVGYQNNLATLNANPNNLRHMIFIFIYSTEYRQRFGPP